MTDTVTKNEVIQKIYGEQETAHIYPFRERERIKTVHYDRRGFLGRKVFSTGYLYRKFSLRNMVEKYSLSDETGNITAEIVLKVYKDSVYIINAEITGGDFEKELLLLTQVAVEKAIYNTSNQTVIINLSLPYFIKNGLKKVLTANGFVSSKEQSEYEKNMFGEELILNAKDNKLWLERIKSNPMLINK